MVSLRFSRLFPWSLYEIVTNLENDLPRGEICSLTLSVSSGSVDENDIGDMIFKGHCLFTLRFQFA